MKLIDVLTLMAYSKHGWMIVHSVNEPRLGYGGTMRWIGTVRLMSGGHP